jgi:acyl-CoA-binding protein
MSNLEDDFNQAAEQVRELPQRPDNDELLQLYAWYKQATSGDVKGRRPRFTDYKGRAKHDAWARKRGKSREEAMSAYVELVADLKRKYNGE